MSDQTDQELRAILRDEVKREVRAEIWDEIETTLHKKWNLSGERWMRFLKVLAGAGVFLIVSILGWSIVSLVGASFANSDAIGSWDRQCRIDGGNVFRSDDAVRACAVGTEIVRYYE